MRLAKDKEVPMFFRQLVRFWMFRIVTSLATSTLLLLGGWLVWRHFFPPSSGPSPVKAQAAREACQAAALDLQSGRAGLRTVWMPPVRGDAAGFVDGELRRCVEDRGAPALVSESGMKAFLRGAGVLSGLSTDEEGALEAARAAGADGVVLASLEALERTGDGGARAELQVRLLRTADGAELFARRYGGGDTPDELPVERAGARAAELHPALRLLVFTGVLLLLPLLTFFPLRAAVSRRSNTLNAWLLALYTGLDGLCLFFLLEADLRGWLRVLLFLAGLGLAFLVNAGAMNLALRFARPRD